MGNSHEHGTGDYARAVLRDILIEGHQHVLHDLYCPNCHNRARAIDALAAAGWDEHEFTAALVALQEAGHAE